MEYKSILLADLDDRLDNALSAILNNWFKEGWEYVDSITQSIGGGSYGRPGAVIVIIKKAKEIQL